LNPASAECHFNLASAFNDNEDFQSAREHYKEA
jgi:tetratricopeptide (TPR) repeat protein